MCTLTWWQGDMGRYEVFFNRDELKDRESASPPRVEVAKGVRFLAPIDGRAGGTWLLANEKGITIALLNAYEAGKKTVFLPEWGSRGSLVMSLADAGSLGELEERMGRVEASGYPPFQLVGFGLSEGGALRAASWLGGGKGEIVPVAAAMPVCSSSFDTEAVIGGRARRLREILSESTDGGEGDKLWAYHHGWRADGTIEPPNLRSVRMNRPDSQTWSISRITVDSEKVRFVYEAERPDLGGPAERHEAALSRTE
ncbi:MAG: NRDE family protein [Verrucomicrobiae bacterium]|nr:NRDE family protein [Verrucomicrobiae bacterium]